MTEPSNKNKLIAALAVIAGFAIGWTLERGRKCR